MANVFIEPIPKGEGQIIGYQIEESNSTPPLGTFPTQEAAIEAARRMGHKPLVARVRRTDKGIPDHWRSA